ncbi:MAG: carboxypeptidase-like regulatory domain-containing protein, partial [Melioribacter sp.]|nr:carboxypeptidase-like regulatory domain-containing protein [Melioribacter sp.]
NSIEGKVTDAKTKEPLPFASVYLSGTMIGVSTNIQGKYKMLKVLAGKYSLIVSMIGYKEAVQKIYVTDNLPEKHDFYLEPRPIVMNQIQVNEEHPPEWKNRLEIFRKYFLGRTDFSDECVIENQDEIILSQNETSATEAKCYNPLIIINTALGYKIECLLTRFLCNDEIGKADIVYYPKFVEMTPKNQDELKMWKENRKKEHLGSLRRFLKSLINLTIDENDYTFYYTVNPFSREAYKYVNPKNLVKYQQEKNNYELTFSSRTSIYLYVNNRQTGEESWIILTNGYAILDQEGIPTDPLMIQVTGDFAKKGIANLLPRSWESSEDKQ